MFFKSFDRNRSPISVRPSFKKGAAALAMAVASALPTVAFISAPVRASTDIEQALVLLADQAKPTDAQLLASGAEQYSKGLYEEAQATLQQVKLDALPEADRGKLADTLRKVEAALAQRKAARAEFELGEQALADKKGDEAISHYRAAADNQFADEATRTKAASQIAVAQASLKTTKQDLRSVYKEAVADYKAGRLDAAKTKFEQVQNADYNPGLFDRKPKSFLKSIDEQLAAAKTPAEPVAVTPSPATQPTAPDIAQRTPKQAYEEGVAAYKQGDYAAAKASFAEAQAANYRPGLFKDSPSRYLSMIEAKERKADEAQALASAQPPLGPTTTPVETLTPVQRELLETARLDRLRRQQREYEAQQLVEKAAQAKQENRLADAYTLYAQAAELDPGNRAAADGKSETQLAVTGGGEKSLIDRQINQITLLKQIVSYSFNKAVDDANAAIKAKQFNAAQEAIDAAIVAKESHPGIFKADELAAFDRAVINTRVALAKTQEIETGVAARTATEQAAIDVARRAAAEAEERRRTVQALIRTAQQLSRDQQYQQALGVINQIQAIDPSNDYAIGVKQLVLDFAMIQEQRRTHEKLDQQFRQQVNLAEERKIPYSDVLIYPTNWPDISDTRDRTLLEERHGGSETLEQQALLDRQLPEIRFDEAPLAEVIEFMRDVTGANLFVNWGTLEASGIQRSSPVTARLRNVKFSKVLSTVLAGAGGTSAKLKYAVDDGVITVSTADDINMSTRVVSVHDIRDLLVVAPDFVEPPDFAPKREMDFRNAGRSIPGAAGAGTSRYSPTNPPATGGPVASSGAAQHTSPKTQELVEEITSMIRSQIDPESWMDNGGKFGSLQYLSGQLIVTQTQDNQRQLVSLLDKLRETRAIQVSIEARFLTVQRNFLEDIGVDIDFFFNINDPGNFSPIAVSQGSSTFAQAAATAAPGTIGSSAQPAVTIQGSYLDDFQANFLIRATQAARHSAVVNAPRVTVFNGQQAFVIVAQETAYVADLEPVVGEGVGIFNPIPDVIASGVRLIVQPTVSADRKYVTLALQPTLTQLVSLTNFPVYSFNAPTTGGTGGTVTIASGNLQLPIMNVTAVNTIVSVPDGGTLLLGGQTISGEIEIEEGIPILSKIPFIKRLFTNKSIAKDEQILLILCRPNIIIHREIENQQFPLLNTRTR